MGLIDYLQCAILLAAIFVKRPSGLVAALVFSGCTIVHNVFTASASPLVYYSSAILIDSLVLLVLSMLRPVCLTVYALAWVCLVSMVANIAGLALWWAYMPPTLYNLAFVCIYLGALAVVVKGGPYDVGGRPVRFRIARPAFPRRARRGGYPANTSEV